MKNKRKGSRVDKKTIGKKGGEKLKCVKFSPTKVPPPPKKHTLRYGIVI